MQHLKLLSMADNFIRLAHKRNSLLFNQLNTLKPQLAAAAQKIYDAWDASDEEYGDWQVGNGGICHLIADAMIGVLSSSLPELNMTTISSSHEVHVYVVVGITKTIDDELEEEYYSVDIPPYVYETGGGYSWKKIPNVVFEPGDVLIESSEPLEIDENGDIKEIY